MGLHLKNKNSPPSSPKRIRMILNNGKEHAIQWHSQFTPFDKFVVQVQNFQKNNGLTEMTADEIEDRICQQLSGEFCTRDLTGYKPAPIRKRSGCKSCGGF